MPIDEELGKERAMQYIEALAAGGRFNIQGEYPYVRTFWFRYEDDPENDLRYGSFDVIFEKRINGLTYARISITLDACGNLKDMSCPQFVDNPEAIPAFDKTAMELYCEQYERSLCPGAYSFCPEGELFQCYLVGQLKNGQYFFSVDAQDAWGEAFGYFVSSEKLLDSQGNAYAYLNH